MPGDLCVQWQRQEPPQGVRQRAGGKPVLTWRTARSGSPIPTRSSSASRRRPGTMAEERAPVPAPPRPTDLGETPSAPPEAAADAGDPAPVLEEVSALLAASETRVTKYLALRFAERRCPVCRRRSPRSGSGWILRRSRRRRRTTARRRRPISRSRSARSRRIFTGGGNSSGTTAGGCSSGVAPSRRYACCCSGFSCRPRQEFCRGTIPRTDGRITSGRSTAPRSSIAN